MVKVEVLGRSSSKFSSTGRSRSSSISESKIVFVASQPTSYSTTTETTFNTYFSLLFTRTTTTSIIRSFSTVITTRTT